MSKQSPDERDALIVGDNAAGDDAAGDDAAGDDAAGDDANVAEWRDDLSQTGAFADTEVTQGDLATWSPRGGQGGAPGLPRTARKARELEVEAPTADYPAVSITATAESTLDATGSVSVAAGSMPQADVNAAEERTVSVTAMPAIDDEPEAVVSKPAKRVRPLADTGMHRAMSESAAALALLLPLVAWRPADRLLAAKLQHDVITPHLDAIATAFFAEMSQHPQAKIFLGSDADRGRMVAIPHKHLSGLADDPLSDAWVNARLRLGRVHGRIGLPLGIYLGSVHVIGRLILSHLPVDPLGRRTEDQKLRDLLRRLLAMESALVAHAQNAAQVDALNDAMRQQARTGFVRQYGAQVDPVTLLARPGHLRAQLLSALQQPTRDGRGCAVVAMELVGLEEAAWHRGYAYRDAILSESGARVRATLRGADVGGIEPTGRILTVLTQVREMEVAIVVRRLRTAIEDRAYVIQGHSFLQRLKIGVAVAIVADDVEGLVHRAIASADAQAS